MRESGFLRALRREPVERVPVWIMRQAGRYLPEYREARKGRDIFALMREPKAAAEITMLPLHRFDLDAAVMFSDLTLPLQAAGLDLTIEEDVGPVLADPLRTPADLGRLHRFRASEALPYVLEEIELLVRELRVPLIAFAGGPFTLATYAIEGRGSKEMPRTREFMQREPEAWDALMAFFADVVADYLVDQARAGASVVQVFDSWVGVLSPQAYEAQVLPATRRVFERLRKAGIPSVHFGTGNPELYPLMAQAGGDCIGVDWRIPLDVAWQRIGPSKAIQGNLDPMALLAPRERMLAQARDVLERARGRPGHVFNLGHGIHRTTHPDQVQALVEFVHGCGRAS